MATTKCAKGHIYDPNIYGMCPYCNSPQKVINFAPGEGGGKTAPIGAQNGFGATEEMGHAQAGFGATVEMSHAQGGYNGQTVPLNQNETQPPWGGTVVIGPNGIAKGNRLVVGWLVCIEGPEKGNDYRLFTGKNYIGRSVKSDICIEKDKAVSAEEHALIAYDSNNNCFYMADGRGRNINYLNGKPILGGSAELNPYDVIKTGETKLVFVPFCGEHFMWAAEEKTVEEIKAGETAWMNS